MTMIQKMFVGGLMLFSVVGCQSPKECHVTHSAGRYQLSEDQRYLYLTDTATGKVSRRGIQPRDGETWESLGGPTTQP